MGILEPSSVQAGARNVNLKNHVHKDAKAAKVAKVDDLEKPPQPAPTWKDILMSGTCSLVKSSRIHSTLSMHFISCYYSFNNNTNALLVKWNRDSVSIPTDQWTATSGGRQVLIERTVDVNTVRATVSGLLQMDIRVVPIGEKENRVHHYHLPSDDVFAHLEVTFRFFGLSEAVEGVLGKTYRAGYVSPVKRGVPMPTMGGEDKYRTPSLYSPSCKMCVLQRPSLASINVL